MGSMKVPVPEPQWDLGEDTDQQLVHIVIDA